MIQTIKEKIKHRQTFSFEIFPPKKENDHNLENIFDSINKLTFLSPDFVSVTFGAGGGNRDRVEEIAEFIQNKGFVALAHLTSVGYGAEEIEQILESLYWKGVRNILALRGDIPEGVPLTAAWKDFCYAKDLIGFIKKDGRFAIGAAAYPEGHVENKDLEQNIWFMQEKVEAGVDFFITQLFFDNSGFYSFMEQIATAGIERPIIAGIMPVLNVKQIKRIVKLSGASIPGKLRKLLLDYECCPVSMEQAGIEYAVEQISDLLSNDVAGVHLYTMNKVEKACQITKQLGLSTETRDRGNRGCGVKIS